MNTHMFAFIVPGILLLWIIAAIVEIAWLRRGLRDMDRNKRSARKSAPITDHRYDPKQSGRRQ